MAERTGIAWTDTTWNPVTGCTKVSEGCRNCYASAIAGRFWGAREFTDVRTHADRLDAPLRWRKPRRVFVNSMSDLFHDAVPDEFIGRVFAVMGRAPQHTFQILTKRPERMQRFCDWNRRTGNPPLRNVWLGVSCEDQETADERVPLLLQVPAAVRFLSCEPLLGPIDLRLRMEPQVHHAPNQVDWVIVGGESGRGFRPMDLDWARSLREQCAAASVPFFFKQVSALRSGQGEAALGEIVQEFPR
jgi:protein gp37